MKITRLLFRLIQLTSTKSKSLLKEALLLILQTKAF